MRIANNITALSTYNSYIKNNKNISGSVKKLSTGYQINSAADNAAGLAISEKMRAQIRGLEQASKNSQDAISMVQTAEGALQSIHDMLQRMRELSVQSASDTNEQTIDRAAIQAEFEQLQAEINDTASKTRFNDQNLIDGTFQQNISRLASSTSASFLGSIKSISVDAAAANNYTVNVRTVTATTASVGAGQAASVTANTASVPSGGVWNGLDISFDAIDTDAHNGNTYTLNVTGGDASAMTFQLMDSNNNIVATANNVDCTTFTSDASKKAVINFSGVGSVKITLGTAGSVATADEAKMLSGITFAFGDGKVDALGNATTAGVTPTVTDPIKGAIVLELNGEAVTLYKGDTTAIFKDSGISFSFKALSDNDIAIGGADFFGADKGVGTGTLTSTSGSFRIDVTFVKGKTMIIQSGANEGDNLKINIDAMDTSTLGISYSSVDTQANASKAITEVNNAINKVSTQRSALGALQNRLDFKINNLDTSAENLTSAESLIRDVDMAKEMTKFTNANILQQAATAMLAQANALPQNVLSLLG